MAKLVFLQGISSAFHRFLFFLLASWCSIHPLASQGNVVIRGKVIDSSNSETIIGANVLVRDAPNLGAVTDVDGLFNLSVASLPVTVVVSYIGYKAQEISIVERSSGVITVYLSPDFNSLDEVVVVGYGKQRKSDLTGALSRISEEQIRERPIQNVVQALQGKASGVDITSNLRPGTVGEVRIRGNRSINASNEALYVVDGIPLSSNISAINPNDIASVEILKDASATAIYGSRGANGVILISLKEGKQGRVSINYDASFSFDQLHSTTDWMSSGDLLNWQRQSHINGGTYTGKYGSAPDPDFDIQKFGGGEEYGINSIKTAYVWNEDGSVALRDATPQEIAGGYAEKVPVYNPGNMFDQHWADLITRTGLNQNHQLSLSAGTDKSRVYLSLGYLDQQSALIDQDYKRYSLNIKGDITPRRWLTIGLALNGTYSKQNYGIAENTANSGAKDSYGQALALMPYARAYDDDGNILNTNRVGLSAHNPLLNFENATNEHLLHSLLSNTYAEVRFTPWLKYNVRFGAQFAAVEYGSAYGANYTNPFSAVGTAPLVAYNDHDKRFSWTLENLLFLEKQFSIHNVGITLLQSSQEDKNTGINIRSQDVTFPTSLWYNLAENGVGKPMGYGTSFSRAALSSYMGRINYALLNKYLLTATGRWDGSSVLAEGHKWEFFPSLALAWKLENEEFLKDIQWLDQLKLRYGWGVTGNSSVRAYSTSGSIKAAAYVFNETQYSGYKSESMPNQELGWEKTAQHNLGLDFSILENRISGTAEVYQAETNDLLMSQSIPPVLGYNSIQTNIGKTKNDGFELSISSLNINGKKFKWRTDFNWATNNEEILELANGKVDDAANGWYIGYPIRVFRDYKYERLWQDDDQDSRLIELYKKIGNITVLPGQAKVKDQELVIVPSGTPDSKSVTLNSGEVVTYLDNGFGKIDDNDKEILGSNRPDWVAGLTNTFNYRDFEFGFFVYAKVGNLYNDGMQTYGRRVETDVWSPANKGAKYPQPTTASFTSYNSSLNYVDATLIALRYVSLSYNIPKKILHNYQVNNVQLYGQVLNPFIWGGEAVKVGLNTDDQTGQTANTILNRSFVVGIRIEL
jgi:TonB-linked SusC/RagA family outer membrane protein